MVDFFAVARCRGLRWSVRSHRACRSLPNFVTAPRRRQPLSALPRQHYSINGLGGASRRGRRRWVSAFSSGVRACAPLSLRGLNSLGLWSDPPPNKVFIIVSWPTDPQPWAELPAPSGYMGSGLGEDLLPNLAGVPAAPLGGTKACLGNRSPAGVRLRALRESVDEWPLANINLAAIWGSTEACSRSPERDGPQVSSSRESHVAAPRALVHGPSWSCGGPISGELSGGNWMSSAGLRRRYALEVLARRALGFDRPPTEPTILVTSRGGLSARVSGPASVQKG